MALTLSYLHTPWDVNSQIESPVGARSMISLLIDDFQDALSEEDERSR